MHREGREVGPGAGAQVAGLQPQRATSADRCGSGDPQVLGSRVPARCSRAASRIKASRFNEPPQLAESVPSATAAPARRQAVRSAIPLPSWRLLCGLCTSVTPRSASRASSVSSTQTLWAVLSMVREVHRSPGTPPSRSPAAAPGCAAGASPADGCGREYGGRPPRPRIPAAPGCIAAALTGRTRRRSVAGPGVKAESSWPAPGSQSSGPAPTVSGKGRSPIIGATTARIPISS